MRTVKAAFFAWMLVALCFATQASAEGRGRWSEQQANDWYAQQGLLIGANYIPANAINQLEMWQADSFDPKTIDKELGWAQAAGMNTMRVFLHDLLWDQDPEGFKKRVDTFLAIAAKHHIKPLLVIFDSCWDPFPKLGTQHAPTPGVHNSGWVQSPGDVKLHDPKAEPALKAYVQGIVGAFAQDNRILGWDLWNEPDNLNGAYTTGKTPLKQARVAVLIPQVFAWARAMNPSQPLTSGIWDGGDWSVLAKLNPVQKTQLEMSDVITFHNYEFPEKFEKRIAELAPYHRPILCSEYMARGADSLMDLDLPIAKKHNVSMINWGLVLGKTQTNFPWDSWQHPYVGEHTPTVWFHDIFHPDGKPYRQREIELIQDFTKP